LREVEHFIAQQLDGARNIEEVSCRVQERFGAGVSKEKLEAFIERLRGLGLLTGGLEAGWPHRPGRVAGDLFYIRLRAFDPDRLFARVIGHAQFFFTPAFVAFSAALITFALGLTVSHWPEISREFVGLFHFESLLLAWVISLGVLTLHEFAHGLTCKYFGGEVRELGFLLIYLQPAFYCNISDAWLFADKSKRLWVTFAGAYFEMFLWALSTVIWRLTDPSTTLNHLALVVTATSAIRSLFNLNPLIKLDGYYLLSDWLEIPNLRRRAFQYLGQLIRRPWAAFAGAFQHIPVRERRIYVIYGLLAGAYSFWILALVLLAVGRYLTARYEGWGAVFFSVLLAGFFRSPIRRSFLRMRAACNEAAGKVRVAKKLAKTLLLLAGLGTLLYFCPMELKVSGDFTILPVRNAEVRAEVEGFIEDITQDESQPVPQGGTVARLTDRDLRAELRKLAAEIEEKIARLNLLKAGSRPEEIQLAKTTVAKEEERLKYSRARLDIDRSLFDQLLLSRRDFQNTAEEVSVREQELQEDKNRLQLLLAGSRAEEVDALQAEVNRGLAQQHYLESQLKLLTVTSPVAGIITTHRPKEKIGQHVQKGDLIITVQELDTVTAEIAVSEKDISVVHMGQRVTLKARAFSQTQFEGTVTAIAPLASDAADWREQRTILVTTRLENHAHLLLPKMSGRAKIYCGQKTALQLVLRRLVSYLRVEFWSWW
jgi:multidrug resistance efflux pump